MSDHILIVDDDADIRDLLGQYLEKNGYRVTTAANGRQMRSSLAVGGIDLIVLDLMLPGEDGVVLCRDLRASGMSSVPVLMLTARSDEADRILGLEIGADDYLTKPFAARELMARIRAVLRRARALPPDLAARDSAAVLGFGSWRLDTRTRSLLDKQGTTVMLTAAEYRLLRVFVDHPQRVLSRDQLLNLTQGREGDPYDRSIDILVSRLRSRLRDEVAYIKTIRNEGYVFAADVRACGDEP